MNETFLDNIISQIKSNKELEEIFSVEYDVNFIDKEILIDDLKSLTEFVNSNYDMEPFACDATGGVYVILNDMKIGYIDSEGGAGIVANNLRDFFSIVTSCGSLSEYAYSDCLKNDNDFMICFNKYNKLREKDVIKRFIEDNSLENNPKKIYELFKNAVMTEPKLLLNSISDEYVDVDYEMLFKF